MVPEDRFTRCDLLCVLYVVPLLIFGFDDEPQPEAATPPTTPTVVVKEATLTEVKSPPPTPEAARDSRANMPMSPWVHHR